MKREANASRFPDYPFAGRYADLQGLRMHYLDEGEEDAAPVVMVHGNPSWSFYFRRLVLALRGDFRCIVPDHIGMGLSDKPAEGEYHFTLGRRVDDLEALLNQLDISGNITLVLHDWGGMIGVAYGVRYPERIKRLVVMNTAAFHPPGNKRLPWQLFFARMPFIGALSIRGLNSFTRGAARSCVTRRPMAAGIRNAYLHPYNSWHNRLAVLQFVRDIPLRPGEGSFKIVDEVQAGLHLFKDIPLLICWGMRDFVFDKDFFAGWTGRFPAAEVHCFEDAGHYVLEDAAEEIVPLVLNFLANHKLDGE